MIREELSGKIIIAAMDVLNELKVRLDDPAAANYERAMIFVPDLIRAIRVIRRSFEPLKILASLAPKDATSTK
jgi:hypothetical protein